MKANVVAFGRSVGQTGSVPQITALIVGQNDASFLISMNLNILALTAGSISGQVSYTDENGNPAQMAEKFANTNPRLSTWTEVIQVSGAGGWSGIPFHIRAKAGTPVTISTTASSDFAGTYNAEAQITQVD